MVCGTLYCCLRESEGRPYASNLKPANSDVVSANVRAI
jgi:hypothetical protein